MSRGNRPRLTRSERHRQTRVHLLDAAERIFARDGYRDASVGTIAEEAGYSHGAIYSNFSGKHDLFLALIEERIDSRLARVYDAADAELGQGGQPVETARRFASLLRQERDALLLLVDFWNQAVRDPKVAARFADRHDRLRSVVGQIVEQAAHRQGRQLTVSGDQLAVVFIALFNGFAIESLANPDAAPEDLLSQAIDALIQGLSEDV